MSLRRRPGGPDLRACPQKLWAFVGEPHAYLADVIAKIVNGHPNSQIDELLPWAYSARAFRRLAPFVAFPCAATSASPHRDCR
jgi:hypothetical protein